jgi:hypothetical protein
LDCYEQACNFVAIQGWHTHYFRQFNLDKLACRDRRDVFRLKCWVLHRQSGPMPSSTGPRSAREFVLVSELTIGYFFTFRRGASVVLLQVTKA